MMDERVIDKQLEQNFCLKVSCLPRMHPAMHVDKKDNGITTIDTNVTSDTFNVVCGGDFSGSNVSEKVCESGN